jgi:citrate lyase subunit beta/citryl-CoA lyase
MKPARNSNDIPVRLERSMLFVPAAVMSVIEKAARSAADAVCIDLEDSVALDQKAASRANVARAFNGLDFGGRLRMFRINALDTPFAYRDLIEVVEGAGKNIDLIMLPKVDSPDDVVFLDKLLGQIEANCGFENKIGIEAQIETAAGFLNIRKIAQSSSRLEALIFGPGDYAASMQMPAAGIGEFDAHDELYPGHRWHAVMHTIVAAARASGLRCIDGPVADYKDLAGLERSCKISRSLGFDGKQCVHPAQLPIANAVFTPSPEEKAHAEEVVRAYEQAKSNGRGVVGVKGKMIDAASVRIAQTILERQRLIAGKSQ